MAALIVVENIHIYKYHVNLRFEEGDWFKLLKSMKFPIIV